LIIKYDPITDPIRQHLNQCTHTWLL